MGAIPQILAMMRAPPWSQRLMTEVRTYAFASDSDVKVCVTSTVNLQKLHEIRGGLKACTEQSDGRTRGKETVAWGNVHECVSS